MPAGRESTYKPEYDAVALNAAERGATQHEIGDVLGITDRTVRRWAAEHESFASALKAGADVADKRVIASLYHRAVGYSHEAVKLQVVGGEVVQTAYVEHHPPDTTAAIFWLKDRRKGEWSDRQVIAGDPDAPLTKPLSADELADQLVAALAKAEKKG